jgi:hypothetical protein
MVPLAERAGQQAEKRTSPVRIFLLGEGGPDGVS